MEGLRPLPLQDHPPVREGVAVGPPPSRVAKRRPVGIRAWKRPIPRRFRDGRFLSH